MDGSQTTPLYPLPPGHHQRVGAVTTWEASFISLNHGDMPLSFDQPTSRRVSVSSIATFERPSSSLPLLMITCPTLERLKLLQTRNLEENEYQCFVAQRLYSQQVESGSGNIAPYLNYPNRPVQEGRSSARMATWPTHLPLLARPRESNP